ncbi:MAG: TonB-dependent receptor [Tannerella sp.]|nr:TonB-dependent receptor [Tannerella sp.]
MKIVDLFEDIEKQTNMTIAYSESTIDVNRTVSINISNKPVLEAMSEILKGTRTTCKIQGKHILVVPVSTKQQADQEEGKKVSGIVTDEKGEPLAGASIMEKGIANGTVTDVDGKFRLNVLPNAILVVSFIGYTTQEVATGNKTNLNVTLQEDSQLLEEVVVVGYGMQKKVNLAGAVETVSSKVLENRSTSNVALALQGLVPNLTITPGGGQANDAPSFNIRGTTSINGGSPLILVDGIPTNTEDFSRMNSLDIDNISVLKDASSAAIYGARAAFGVILVTTKKGQGDKLTVHFNNNFNVRTLTRMPEVVFDPYIQTSYKQIMGKPWYNFYTDEEIEYARRLRDDPSLPNIITNSLDPSKYTYLANTDWFHEIYDRMGTARSHNLSISGASPKVSYYLGAEFYQERGMLKINKDLMDRYNVRSHVEYKPTEWLTVGNNMALTYSTYNRPTDFASDTDGDGDTDSDDSQFFEKAMFANPLVPIRNPDGSYTERGADMIGSLVEGGDSDTKKSTIYTQFTADLELVKDIWNVKADFTAKLVNSKVNEWGSDRSFPYRDGPDSPDKYMGWPNYAQSKSGNTGYTMFNLYTDIRKTFGIHNLSALGGFSQEYERYEYFYGRRVDLITDTYPTPQLATGEMTVNESTYDWAVRSAFYRLNYIIDNKYIFETNGRYDGTSRFPKENRFGFFPSVSAAWVLSNERFFESLSSWFNHAKIRGSYGSLGNQAVNSYYPYLASMEALKLNYLVDGDKPMGIYPPGLVSAALTWEKVYTLNGGVDINFLNNRLSVTADMYRRDTKDMLTKGKTLPNVLGTDEPRINAADLKTTGWELSFLWRDRFNAGRHLFNYSARFILSDSRSFITKFDNPTGYLNDYYVGQELGEMWGLETLGFFEDQADINNSPTQWDVTSYPGDRPIEPGDLKYKDQNGDNVINYGERTLDNPGDFKIIGNSSSRYNYGFDFNADWNGFDLRIFLQGVGKKSFYPTGYIHNGIFKGPWGSVLTNNLDHWTPENPDAHYPRLKSYLDWFGVGDLGLNQTRYMQNAAYMRLKNLTFGYSLPKQVTERVNINNIRLYFSGENLLEITKLSKNYDPEGLNETNHPFQRTFSIGLNITL